MDSSFETVCHLGIANGLTISSLYFGMTCDALQGRLTMRSQAKFTEWIEKTDRDHGVGYRFGNAMFLALDFSSRTPVNLSCAKEQAERCKLARLVSWSILRFARSCAGRQHLPARIKITTLNTIVIWRTLHGSASRIESNLGHRWFARLRCLELVRPETFSRSD